MILAGGGPKSEGPRALAERLGVKARFLGAMPQAALRNWMAAADVFLFPSATETFGNVVLEALACGAPVVGAAGGAVPDTIRYGKNGILCRPGDADDFAAALERLYSAPGLRRRLGEEGLRLAAERSWERVFAELLADVERAVSEVPQLFDPPIR